MNIFSTDCLKGGTYLVTGASSGMGKATAYLIAASGGRVIACGRDKNRLTDTLINLSGSLNHKMVTHNFIDSDHTASFLDPIFVEDGPLNGIFHAAGCEYVSSARLLKQAQLNNLLSSSLYAAFGIAKAISKKNAMVAGGSIVLMSSTASLRGVVGATAYSAVKAGINGLVRSLACELAPKRIRVNSIVSGMVKTSMYERWIETGGTKYDAHHLLGLGEPQDIAHAALFLLSNGSNWITGNTLTVDSGYLAH